MDFLPPPPDLEGEGGEWTFYPPLIRRGRGENGLFTPPVSEGEGGEFFSLPLQRGENRFFTPPDSEGEGGKSKFHQNVIFGDLWAFVLFS